MIEHQPHSDCAHAADQAERSGEALRQAEEVCRARGARLTAIRREVLEALYATHRPLGAYDLVEAVKPRGARRLAPITVYRALDFLIAQGLVHRLASRNAFVACPHGHGPSELVAFLICEACGGVDEVSSPRLTGALTSVLQEQGFAPGQQLLEVAGTCGHCRDRPPATPAVA